jgi:hypothetical protein
VGRVDRHRGSAGTRNLRVRSTLSARLDEKKKKYGRRRVNTTVGRRDT